MVQRFHRFSMSGLFRGVATSGLALLLGCFNGEDAFDVNRLEVQGTQTLPTARSSARVFYSGHSLSEGLPDIVRNIAQSRGDRFIATEHNFPGSTIRERASAPWPRQSVLDEEYDTLVVTERHDLLYTLLFENTLPSLLELQKRVAAGRAAPVTFLYQSWLEIDLDAPQHFVDFERHALVVWECTASALNRRLPGDRQSGLTLVLPGGWALAELVEQISKGRIVGLRGSLSDNLRRVFGDSVHLTALGRYYMGALHYAFLFYKSPVGTLPPMGLSKSLARDLQQLAWQMSQKYSRISEASARREASVCRDYAVQVMANRFTSHPRDGARAGVLRRWKQTYDLQRSYSDASSAANPFR